MKSTRRHPLAALVALACALVQPAVGHAPIAAALAFGHAGDDHTHTVSVESDVGHFDLVLSHDHAGDPSPNGVGHEPEHSGSCSEPDHVLHLGEGATSCRTTRPDAPDSAPLIALSFEQPCAEPCSRSHSIEDASQSYGASHLRSVVLQL